MFLDSMSVEKAFWRYTAFFPAPFLKAPWNPCRRTHLLVIPTLIFPTAILHPDETIPFLHQYHSTKKLTQRGYSLIWPTSTGSMGLTMRWSTIILYRTHHQSSKCQLMCEQ